MDLKLLNEAVRLSKKFELFIKTISLTSGKNISSKFSSKLRLFCDHLTTTILSAYLTIQSGLLACCLLNVSKKIHVLAFQTFARFKPNFSNCSDLELHFNAFDSSKEAGKKDFFFRFIGIRIQIRILVGKRNLRIKTFRL